MITLDQKKEILALIKREVVPAIGCTEPAAVALCVAKATELLGSTPESLDVRLSANILKNAMGVGIPGTGMIGLPIAVALGALIGKSDYGLGVLRDVCPEAVEKGKSYLEAHRPAINVKVDAPSILHIEVTALGGGRSATAVISGSHTNFVYLERDGEVLLDELHKAEKAETKAIKAKEAEPQLNLATVWEFATTLPAEDLEFILEAARLNIAAAELALQNGGYGHSLGFTIRHHGAKLFGDSPVDHILAYTSAACDARMAGANVPVMSNSGSGNQGITATMPVVVYAWEVNADRERTIRALTLSHLLSIYIKQSLGRLSALCGCVVAATGASSGLVYLMGGGYEQVCSAVKNMVANLTGMICDGAKPSCAMKISSGVSTAVLSAMLAMEGRTVTSAEGIVADDVDQTIRNLTDIGRDAMRETDREVLHIMTTKNC